MTRKALVYFDGLGSICLWFLCSSLAISTAQDALQELASSRMGYLANGVPHSSGRRAAKFTFTQGTGGGGGGKRNGTRRNAAGGGRKRV